MDGKHLVSGIVTDCNQTSVRAYPESFRTWNPILAIVYALNEVRVDLNASTKEFYKVRTSDGVEGYCRKKYIAITKGRADDGE